MCSPRCMTRHGYQPYVYTVKIRISLRPKSEPQAWFTVHAVPFAEGWGKKKSNLDEDLRSMAFSFSLGSLPFHFPSFPCTEMHKCGYLLHWVRSFVFPCRQLQQRERESDKSVDSHDSQGCPNLPQPYPRIRHNNLLRACKRKFHPRAMIMIIQGR